jgi:hypothetical protein
VDSLVTAMESLHEFTDNYGNTYSFGPNQHHGSTKAFLAVVKDGRWVRTSGGQAARLLIPGLGSMLIVLEPPPAGVAQTTTARDPSGNARCASMPSERTISAMRGSVMTLNAVDRASAMVASAAMTETAAKL